MSKRADLVIGADKHFDGDFGHTPEKVMARFLRQP
jgi:hypothetical protein